MAKILSKKKVVDLQEIVKCTLAGTIIYTSPDIYEQLVKDGLVEVNPVMVDPVDVTKIATRATQAGIDLINARLDAEEEAKSKPPVEKPVFTIEADIPVPAGSVRSGRSNIYPFDSLELGQSFFVANTEAKPNMAKSLASTVSSANARFSVSATDGSTRKDRKGVDVPVMVKTRNFIVKPFEKDGVKGARIWRTL